MFGTYRLHCVFIDQKMHTTMKYVNIFLLFVGLVSASNDDALKQFVTANNLFAADAYSKIFKNESDNFVVSPYSAEIILALTKAGCRGETAQEMKDVLHLPDDEDQVKVGAKESLSTITNNEQYTLESANKMYVKQDYPIKDDFKNTAVEIYGADVENVDFVKNVEATKQMNQWVEEKTHNKIHDLIDPSTIDNDTRVVLINALYFKGNWSTQFLVSETEKEDFHRINKDAVKVDMMHHTRKMFNYYESPELNAKFLELPFEGGDVSMVIALPNDRDGLTSLENQISKVFYPHPLRKELVNVALPKFKIESTVQFKEILKQLGIRKAFNDEADLSGIAGIKGELGIDEVLQKAFVEIDEKGGEAAAATYVEISFLRTGPIPRYERHPKDFIADHPFIFYIKAKNFIIFAGRVLEPKH